MLTRSPSSPGNIARAAGPGGSGGSAPGNGSRFGFIRFESWAAGSPPIMGCSVVRVCIRVGELVYNYRNSCTKEEMNSVYKEEGGAKF